MAEIPLNFFYSDGTMTLTNGSDLVTGTFTSWDPGVQPMDIVFPNDGQSGASVVGEVLSATEMRLAKPWTGPTLTGVPYFILRWIKHTDPRRYGLMVSEYLSRLRQIPENFEEVGQQVAADAAAVASALTTITQAASDVEADRQAVAGDRAAAETARSGAEAALAAAEDVLDQVQAGSVADNAITDVKVAPNAGIAASKISATAPATGGTTRTLIEVLLDRPPSVAWYGATGNGTDQTAALQKALNAHRALFFPPGTYKTTATLVTQHAPVLIGTHGWEATVIERGMLSGTTQNWSGPTMRIGPDNSSYSFHVEGLKFSNPHAGFDPTTDLVLPSGTRLTDGQAHIEARGCTNSKITRCWFENGVYGVDLLGGTTVEVSNCQFVGLWDDQAGDRQETMAYIRARTDTVNGSGYPTLHRYLHNFMGGNSSPLRTWTVGTVTFQSHHDCGAAYGILVEGAEGMEIKGGYIGANNRNGVFLAPNGMLTNVDIEGIFFDAFMESAIKAQSLTSGQRANIVNIVNNRFNGQMHCPNALRIESAFSGYSLSGLVFQGNIINATTHAPLFLMGLQTGLIRGNIIGAYHSRGGLAGSPTASAGVYVGDQSRDVHLSDNFYGGGVNSFSGANNAQWGAYFENSSYGTASNERGNLGLAGGSLIGGNTQTYPT